MENGKISATYEQVEDLKNTIIQSHTSLHSDMTETLIRLNIGQESIIKQLEILNGRVGRSELRLNEMDIIHAENAILRKSQKTELEKWTSKAWHMLWVFPTAILTALIGWLISGKMNI